MARVEKIEPTSRNTNPGNHKPITLLYRTFAHRDRTYVYLANSASNEPESQHMRQVILLDQNTGPQLLKILMDAYGPQP